VGACLPLFRHRDEVEVLDRWAGRVLGLGLALPAGWIEQRGRLVERFDRLAGSRPVLCHRDLHDGQIVVAGGRIALLDFDLLCIADSALDPANLLAHLELRALQGVAGCGVETLAVLSSAFLEGLESEDSDFGSRLRAYRASSLLRLALVYSVRPPWRGVVPALVHRAGRWLGR
jgi:aminoglycoside phosphotransferase (APT) family kinase protein